MSRVGKVVSLTISIICMVLAIIYMFIGEDTKSAVLLGWAIINKLSSMDD